jgi:peptidoglycan/xylan/chitin deacetylase (PgdA/CDA1 family)
MRLPVLLYHHVGRPPSGGDPGLTVSPERFEAQVRWLVRRGYVGIRPSDWLAWRRSARPLPEKPVLLTFDDAYADVAEHAFPVLERYGFGAGVFVVTGQIGQRNAWVEARGSRTLRLMTADQIRDWVRRGIEFGAHSRTHPDLTTLGPAELANEVAGSKADLEAILQSPVVSFAYPYGFYNQAVCECVQSTYDMAFTVDEGLNDLQTDPRLLRRTPISPRASTVDLASRMRWGYNPFGRVRKRVRLRTRLKDVARVLFPQSH